eukprot:TRINITY_DN32003_c0_g1_i1.p1 TRINITY_DN32003_c0_g1~~TRINITY_DN32003_c0_g1_i1.p1  ORF type:complete len:291 (+),score=88.71 TRINITY_DN32003_c0_g1_i1:150-1022(+)
MAALLSCVGTAALAVAAKEPGLSVVGSGIDVVSTENCRAVEWLPGVLAPPIGTRGGEPAGCAHLFRLGDTEEVPDGTALSLVCSEPQCHVLVAHHHEPPATSATNGGLPGLLSGDRWQARYGGTTIDSNGTRRKMVHYQTLMLENETMLIELEKPLRYGYVAWVPESLRKSTRKAKVQSIGGPAPCFGANTVMDCIDEFTDYGHSCHWFNVPGVCVPRICVIDLPDVQKPQNPDNGQPEAPQRPPNPRSSRCEVAMQGVVSPGVPVSPAFGQTLLAMEFATGLTINQLVR